MNTERKRILVVDDRPCDSRLVRLNLERTTKFEVREVNNSRAALDAAKAFQPHLILLDVMMPGLDGGEVAALLRSNPTLQTVPIVFLTSVVSKREVDAVGGRSGGFGFLAKPFILADMIVCLEQHMTGAEGVAAGRGHNLAEASPHQRDVPILRFDVTASGGLSRHLGHRGIFELPR